MQVLPNGQFSVYWNINRSPDPVRSWSKEMDEGVDPNATGDTGHLNNFYAAVRMNDPSILRAHINEAHLSNTTCLLANISQRTGRKLHFDGKAEKFVDDPDADQLLTRTYREPFGVPEKI